MTRRLRRPGSMRVPLALAAGLAACEDPLPPPEPAPLEVEVLSPREGAVALPGDTVVLLGRASADDVGVLPQDSVFWTIDRAPLPPGGARVVTLPAGDHLLHFHARDRGRLASVSRFLRVEPVRVGSVRWSVPLDSTRSVGLSMHGGVLYTHHWGRREVLAVAPDGSVLWRSSLRPGTGTMGEHGPAIAPDGSIVYGTWAGVVAIGPDGTERWSFDVTSIGPGVPHVHGGVAIGSDGTIYFGTEQREGVVVAISPDGVVQWVSHVRESEDDLWQIFGTPVVVGDSQVVVVDRQGRRAAALSRAGEVVWRFTASRFGGTRITGMAVAPGGDVIIPFADSLRRIAPDGSVRWTSGYHLADSWGQAGASAVSLSAGRVYLANNSGGVELYDLESGGYVGRYGRMGVGIQGSVALGANGVAYVLGQDTLFSYASGGVRRFALSLRHDLSRYFPQEGPVIAPDGTVYVRHSDGALVAIADTVGPALDAPWPSARGGSRRLGR